MPEFRVVRDGRTVARIRRETEPPGGTGRSTGRTPRTTEPSSDTHLLSDTESDGQGDDSVSMTDERHPSTRLQSPPRPQYTRSYSVLSGRHNFEVTNYGPGSVDLSPPTASRALHDSDRHPTHRASPITEELTPDLPDASLKLDHQNNIKSFPRSVKIDIDAEEVIYDPSHDLVDTWNCTYHSVRTNSTRDPKIVALAKRGVSYAKRKKDEDRLINKNGQCRIVYSKISNRSWRFLHDFFTTVLELKWRYHMLIFALAFGLSWLLFALIWWALVSIDRSSLYGHLDTNDTLQGSHVPCVQGVTDFPTSLLFSIETQHTIGYGTRAITPYCPFATILLMVQSMFGVIMQCILTGIIFAKMARPKRRAQTILFSKKAVITQRDGRRMLMFRVGDMRSSQVLGVTIRVLLAKRRVTEEGERLPIVTQDVPVTTESGSDFMFLAWPILVVHAVDEQSPLWELTVEQLLLEEWELIVVLEGVGEVTGASFQVRTSYLPAEILWAYSLRSLLSRSTRGLYTIDYTHFHDTVPVAMSGDSAREFTSQHRLHPAENGSCKTHGH